MQKMFNLVLFPLFLLLSFSTVALTRPQLDPAAVSASEPASAPAPVSTLPTDLASSLPPVPEPSISPVPEASPLPPPPPASWVRDDPWDPAHALVHHHDNITRQICFCSSDEQKYAGVVFHLEYYSTLYNRTWYGDYSCRMPFGDHHNMHKHRNECWTAYREGKFWCWDYDNTGKSLCDIPGRGRKNWRYRFISGPVDFRDLTKLTEPDKVVHAFCEEQCQIETGLPVQMEYSTIEYYLEVGVDCPTNFKWVNMKGCVHQVL